MSSNSRCLHVLFKAVIKRASITHFTHIWVAAGLKKIQMDDRGATVPPIEKWYIDCAQKSAVVLD